MRKLINNFVKKYPELSQKIAYKLLYKDQFNVNLDLCNPNQKRVLISYITLTGFDFSKVRHASFYHLNQILHYFVSNDYCVDLCRMDDMGAYDRLKHNKYDVLLGFGPVYKEFCKSHSISVRICFVMENNPVVVREKYKERIEFFKKRHPNLDPSGSTPRMRYFDEETFRLSSSGILMNSQYNARSFAPYFTKLDLINSNAIYNLDYKFEDNEVLSYIPSSRKNVLWFGSLGLIHKGLDILIDAVGDLPNKQLNCYGVDVDDQKLFKKLKKHNTNDCGHINVLSSLFIQKVVMQHNICVLPSCSEGMSTAVATCMAHGIIPIVSRETGYNDCPWIIQIEDVTVDSIKDAISSFDALSDEEILKMRHNCYTYARESFSLENFSNSFTQIMDQLIK